MVEPAEQVIDATGTVIASRWTLVAEDASLPTEDGVLPLARLLGVTPADLPERVGVRLAPADSVEALVPLLARLALIEVSFPRFRDGRGFTQARELREHYGFAGDIRAVGHVLPDQFLSLLRCGVTTFVLTGGQTPSVWRESLALRGGLDTRPVSERALPLLRRLAAPIGVK